MGPEEEEGLRNNGPLGGPTGYVPTPSCEVVRFDLMQRKSERAEKRLISKKFPVIKYKNQIGHFENELHIKTSPRGGFEEVVDSVTTQAV